MRRFRRLRVTGFNLRLSRLNNLRRYGRTITNQPRTAQPFENLKRVRRHLQNIAHMRVRMPGNCHRFKENYFHK